MNRHVEYDVAFLVHVGPAENLLGKQQSIDLKWLNAWNAEKVFGRTYMDKEGNIVFDVAIHLWGSPSPNYIVQSADLFGVMLKSLFEFQPGK